MVFSNILLRLHFELLMVKRLYLPFNGILKVFLNFREICLNFWTYPVGTNASLFQWNPLAFLSVSTSFFLDSNKIDTFVPSQVLLIVSAIFKWMKHTCYLTLLLTLLRIRPSLRHTHYVIQTYEVKTLVNGTKNLILVSTLTKCMLVTLYRQADNLITCNY